MSEIICRAIYVKYLTEPLPFKSQTDQNEK